MTSLQNFTSFLKSFGLTEYESRILLVLFKLNEATAKELTEHTEIAITKIYQVLKQLEGKAFITPIDNEPKIFRGMPARRFFLKVKKDREKSLEKFISKMDEFLDAVADMELQKVEMVKQIHPCLDARRL